MRMDERLVWIVLTVGLLAALLVGRAQPAPASATIRSRPEPGLRISMEALHQQGGVPVGWQMAPPPGDAAAGRRTFADLGCPSCHRVAGEPFAAPDPNLGPDLTGMGAHHPPAYFVEAILNPDAVLIDAPGYIAPDGHSRMPSYPDLTVGQLADLVAYLRSLTLGDSASCHNGATPSSALVTWKLSLENRPAPQGAGAKSYFAQTYDVRPGQIEAFEAWFAHDGRERFLAVDGLVSVDTFVDVTRPNGAVTSLFGFRDEAALRNFMGDPASADLWRQFDAFVGPHGHQAFDRAPVYRAPALSVG